VAPGIAHVVNPVIVPATSDLSVAQPVTFETMRRARDFAHGSVDVELFSAQYPEDRALVPPYFTLAPDLDRSVLDLPETPGGKKLPLIADILERLFHASEADYLIYTNVDIALAESFYVAVSGFIDRGYDAFSITRRTVSGRFRTIDQIPAMYLERGRPHPGWDCFVISRALLPQFVLGEVCIGAPGVGQLLLCNCIRYASQFGAFKGEHLTFHIGNDRVWLQRRVQGVSLWNRQRALEIIERLHVTAPPGDGKMLLGRQAGFLRTAMGRRLGRVRRHVREFKRIVKHLLRS
jgi:hypothetical protein